MSRARPKMEAAVYIGNLERVQELIQSGASVNARCTLGLDTLLNLAVSCAHKDIVLALLAAGADVNAKDPLGKTALHYACDVSRQRGEQRRSAAKDIASALLAAGADVHAKDNLGFTALHYVCKHQLEEVAQALIDRGSPVDEVALGNSPLCLARGNSAISMSLLRAGASCEGLPEEDKDDLFHHACHVGDLLAVDTLLKNGCSVGTLSGEEQHNLLCCACRNGDIPVARALLKTICSAREFTHTELVQLLNPLPKRGKEGLLRGTCIEGDMLVVEALIAVGCSVNCVGPTGGTPLMNAAREGHEEVVKKLILAGANLAMKDENGSTALHYAAIHNHIQCGVLLAEGGASVRTKNKLSQTPLDVAKSDFQEAIKQALSFTTQNTLCIIGNAEGGKSTLIASLQAESNSFFGRIFNRFRRVHDRRRRTAGIEIVPHSSQKYGEVLFFDFAGQDDYHGPHQMFMESLLSKPGVSMTLLLVIKVTELEDAILHQLHRWLTPLALMSTTASPPNVIVIGSFLDKVQSKQEATSKLMRCIEATKSNLEDLPLRFVGTCFLNCRQPQSESIDQLCGFLQEVPVPEFRATHTNYSLAWVLSQIRSSFKAKAVQLQEFSAWIDGNKDSLPLTMPDADEVCQDLAAAGHALYLPNSIHQPKSWLILDLPSILHDVYGTLFSQPKEVVNKFGLIHCDHLSKLFPDLDLVMVQQLLISLEFCIFVDSSVLKVDLSKLTRKEETGECLFFPVLISTKPLQVNSGVPDLSVRSLCWQLRTSKKHSISARILQTILLRLAAHFVVMHHDEEGVQQHCCTVWWNGIAWHSTVGVHVAVHIIHNRVIQVMASSNMANDLCQYLTDVVSDILSIVRRLFAQTGSCSVHCAPAKMGNFN